MFLGKGNSFESNLRRKERERKTPKYRGQKRSTKIHFFVPFFCSVVNPN